MVAWPRLRGCIVAPPTSSLGKVSTSDTTYKMKTDTEVRKKARMKAGNKKPAEAGLDFPTGRKFIRHHLLTIQCH